MPVDTITLEQFKEALPHDEATGEGARHVGLVQGEHCFRLTCDHCDIFIRSSVKANGVSAKCGKDSIRVLLVESLPVGQPEARTPKALAKKLQRWTTRMPGWAERLEAQINAVAEIAALIRPCPKCNELMHLTTIKNGKNAGKTALLCTAKENGAFCNHHFEIVADDEDTRDTPPAAALIPPAQKPQEKPSDPQAPLCPKCNCGMVRMASGKGFRCNAPGNRWDKANGGWSVCNGVRWD